MPHGGLALLLDLRQGLGNFALMCFIDALNGLLNADGRGFEQELNELAVVFSDTGSPPKTPLMTPSSFPWMTALTTSALVASPCLLEFWGSAIERAATAEATPSARAVFGVALTPSRVCNVVY